MTPEANSRSAALALRAWPDGNAVFRALVFVCVGSAILAISAKIKVPFPPVPMTLQTFAVMAIAAAYGSRLAVATVAVYLAEGLLGAPVFTNTPPAIAGPAYFLGPTGGFLIGFLAIAWIVGSAADRGWDRSVPKLFAAMITADVVCFILGFIWLAWFAQLSSGATGIGIAGAWKNGIVPFMLTDLVKIALAACLIPAAWRLIVPKPDAI